MKFKNKQLKTKVWGQIGEAFGITGDEAAKFKSLQEKYVRVKREKALRERSEAGACDDEKWPLFKLLMFLDEVIRQRKTISNTMQKNVFGESKNQLDLAITSSKGNVGVTQLQKLSSAPISTASPVSDELDEGFSQLDFWDDNVLSPASSVVGAPDIITMDTPKKRKETPSVSKTIKHQKVEDKISTTLESIANSIKQPTNEYVHVFCHNLEQEMLKLPSTIMEELKDEITEIVLHKRRGLRQSKINN
ncbi:hypothetical protein FQA39_LY18160 [Lamprigera yunnana]|nr:hypothetical protein FQA39_LY18160 [Lamprigera yunnana]